MKISKFETHFEDGDLKELFSLFTCCTKFELSQVYDKNSDHFYEKVELSEEYSVTEEKSEIALDAWRSVLYFLYKKGYSLYKDGNVIQIASIENDFSG